MRDGEEEGQAEGDIKKARPGSSIHNLDAVKKKRIDHRMNKKQFEMRLWVLRVEGKIGEKEWKRERQRHRKD